MLPLNRGFWSHSATVARCWRRLLHGPRQGRNLVVLCGWLGAQEAHLQKYAKLVAEAPCGKAEKSSEGSLQQRIGSVRVLPFIAPTLNWLRPQDALERVYIELAERILRRARILSMTSGVAEPLVFYVFSGHGACSLGVLLQALRTQLAEPKNARSKSPYVSGVIYDSAPCFIDARVMSRGYLAVATSRFGPSSMQSPGAIFAVLEACFAKLLGAWPSRQGLLDACLGELMQLGLTQPLAPPATLHHSEQNSVQTNTAAPAQLVLLGEGDRVILKTDILEFFRQQRAKGAIEAEIIDFGPDSGHVSHLRHQPARYREAVHEFLSRTHAC